MWISQKVNNDPEIRKTLNEITNLIKSYSDATCKNQQNYLEFCPRPRTPRADKRNVSNGLSL